MAQLGLLVVDGDIVGNDSGVAPGRYAESDQTCADDEKVVGVDADGRLQCLADANTVLRAGDGIQIVDGSIVASLGSDVHGSEIQAGTVGFDQLATPPSCGDGKVLKRASGAWACGTDSEGGGAVAYSGGPGISLSSENEFSLTDSECPANQHVIGWELGLAQCAPDVVNTYAGSNGVRLDGNTFSLSAAASSCDPGEVVSGLDGGGLWQCLPQTAPSPWTVGDHHLRYSGALSLFGNHQGSNQIAFETDNPTGHQWELYPYPGGFQFFDRTGNHTPISMTNDGMVETGGLTVVESNGYLLRLQDDARTSIVDMWKCAAGGACLTWYQSDGSTRAGELRGDGQPSYVDGDFGVGTVSPSARVDIAKSVAGEFRALQLRNSNGSGDIQTAVGLEFAHYNGGTYPAAKIVEQEDGIAHYSGSLQFYTRGNASDSPPDERMRITGSGNVGIGTPGPDAKLHVRTSSGTTGLSIHTADGGPWALRIRNESNALGNSFDLYQDNDGTTRAHTNGNLAWTVRPNGNVGIRSTGSDSHALFVEGTIHASGGFSGPMNQSSLSVSGDVMLGTSGGKVGVGGAPTGRFDVMAGFRYSNPVEILSGEASILQACACADANNDGTDDADCDANASFDTRIDRGAECKDIRSGGGFYKFTRTVTRPYSALSVSEAGDTHVGGTLSATSFALDCQTYASAANSSCSDASAGARTVKIGAIGTQATLSSQTGSSVWSLICCK